jgi:hypothetical protein
MTPSGLLRLRSPEGLAEMQNAVLERLSSGKISASEALAALQSLKRLSVEGTSSGPRPAFAGSCPRYAGAVATGEVYR